MKSSIAAYKEMIDCYLRKEMALSELWTRFNERWSQEDGMPDEEYDILDPVWAEIEMTTGDEVLLSSYPGDYLTEDQLRERLRAASDELATLR